VPRRVHDLAHELCDGRWVATGGGGYDIWRVVPRAWTRSGQPSPTSNAGGDPGGLARRTGSRRAP
jgi:hypothetical protein